MPQDRRALLEELPGWSKKACRYSSERLTPLRKAKPRFRCTTNKPAVRPQPPRRARCEWAIGCDERARRKVDGRGYCKPHAQQVCDKQLAVCSLADYKDDGVETHRGSEMGSAWT